MDYDLPDTEDLRLALSKLAVELARKGWYEMATTMDTAAAKLGAMQDDLEDFATRLRSAEFDRDYLREELYYAQDRLDELQLRLDEGTRT